MFRRNRYEDLHRISLPTSGDRLRDGRAWSCIGRSFDIPLEHRQHARLHDPGDGDVEPVEDEASKPSWADCLVAADDKTCAPARQFVQQEAPEPFHVGRWPGLLRIEVAAPQVVQPTQSQEAIRFEGSDLPSVHRTTPCPILHVVAEGQVLPLGVDFLGTGPTPVVEAVPGVPAAAIAAHLDKPRPDLIRWRLDRDGHRRPPLALGDQVGAGIRPSDFIIGCAPAPEPRAHPGSMDDWRHDRRTGGLAAECHMASLGTWTGRHQGHGSHMPATSERDCRVPRGTSLAPSDYQNGVVGGHARSDVTCLRDLACATYGSPRLQSPSMDEPMS